MGKKMRGTHHSARKNSNGGFSKKHNDRNFDYEKAANIDETRTKDNIYWNCFNGLYKESSKQDKMTFEQVEEKYYKKAFNRQWVDTNYSYEKQGHKDRCKTFEEWSKQKNNLPEELYMQIGNKEEHPDEKKSKQVFSVYQKKLANWSKQHGNPFSVLDFAIHVDEAVPQMHLRRVWQYRNNKGVLCIGQEQALKQAGIDLPKPNEKTGRYNNRKMVFDKLARDMYLESCLECGLDIENNPLLYARHNMTKQDAIDVKLAEKQKELEDREAHIKDLELQAQENLLKTEKALKMANTSSQDYYNYQAKWIEAHGLKEQCFNDYCNYKGLNDVETESKQSSYEF